MAVLQRILRIWPAYILTMMIYYGVYMHTGGGPRWKNSNEQIVNICQSMWRSIFFVENIIDNGEEICLGWGWYLQVDFQIFLGCIVILFLYQKSKLASYLLTGGLMLFSFLMNILWTQK
jgi:peptidoglycan/LPS O-acetylase OafA/YrhL